MKRVVFALLLTSVSVHAQVTGDVPAARPDAIVDLATPVGVRLVKGEWRYSDTTIVEVDHRAVGADLKASGAPTKAYDIDPHAGDASYDDRAWEVLDPERLDARRSKGRLAFSWSVLRHDRGARRGTDRTRTGCRRDRGGVWILSPDGRHLGTIRGPELPANMAWGDRMGALLSDREDRRVSASLKCSGSAAFNIDHGCTQIDPDTRTTSFPYCSVSFRGPLL